MIDNLTENINQYKESLNELEIDNQKVEILALLREFCLIDTYNDDISKKDIEENKNTLSEEIKPVTFDNNSNNDLSSDKELDIKESSNNNLDIFSNKKAEDTTKETNSITRESTKKYLDNEIVKVENAEHIDIEYIQSKASKVMQRVGEMLGIKPKESKVVSFEEKTTPSVPEKEERKSETKVMEQPLPKVENPLFSNNVSNNLERSKEEKSSAEDKFKFPENNSTNNDFWFSSDTPDALKELPDLDVPANKDVFGNNFTPSLDFPDLNLNFGPNSKEEN